MLILVVNLHNLAVSHQSKWTCNKKRAMMIRYRVWSEGGVAFASRQSYRLLLSTVKTACVDNFLCGWDRCVADKICRITILLDNSSKVVNFLVKLVLRADDPSGLVAEPSHHIFFHVGCMDDGTQSGDTGPCAWASCRQRHPDCHSLFFWLACWGKGASHLIPAPQWSWWLAWPWRSSSAEQKVSSTYLIQSLGRVNAISSTSFSKYFM